MPSKLENLKRQREKRNRTGLCQVYICHSTSFSGRLRPYHNSTPMGQAELTDTEVRTLRNLIHKYLGKCHERRQQ